MQRSHVVPLVGLCFVLALSALLFLRGSAPEEIESGQPDEEGSANVPAEDVQDVELPASREFNERTPTVLAGDHSRFLGRVVCAEQDDHSLAEAVTSERTLVRIADAAEALLDDSVEGALMFGSYSLLPDGAFVPRAEELFEEFLCDDQSWQMPVPRKDLVVLAVLIGGVEQRIISPRLIPAGTTEFSIDVIAPGRVEITVQVGTELVDLSQLSFSWSYPAPSGRPIQLTATQLSTLRPEAERGKVLAPPGPPTSARELEVEVAGVGRGWVSSVEYERLLWVGSEGFGWRRALIDAGPCDVVVDLRRTGQLSVDVRDFDAQWGGLEVSLRSSGRPLISWPMLWRDDTLRAKDIPEGTYMLEASQARAAGMALVASRQLVIAGGDELQTELNLGEVLAGAVMGELNVLVKMPTDLSARPRDLQLLVAPARNGNGLLQGSKSVRLTGRRMPNGSAPEIETIDGVAEVAFGSTEVGAYYIGVAPLGLLTKWEVRPNALTAAFVDLSVLCDIRFALRGAGGAPFEGDASGVQVRWYCIGESSPREVAALDRGDRLASHGLSDGVWVATSAPGRIVAAALSSGGDPLGPPVEQDVYPGVNSIGLIIDERRVRRQQIEIVDVDGSDLSFYRQALLKRGLFEASNGPVSVAFCEGDFVRSDALRGSAVFDLVFFGCSGKIFADWKRFAGSGGDWESEGTFDPSSDKPRVTLRR